MKITKDIKKKKTNHDLIQIKKGDEKIEIWRNIIGYEGTYLISNFGNIKSLPRKNTKGKVLNPSKNNRGYLRVTLSVEGKTRYDSVHRLVAETFIPNPKKLPEVNHLDGNKLNNNVENLEWVTKGQNQIHAYKTGLRKTTQKQRDTSRKNIEIARLCRKKG